jgi:uncharacterized protein (TIGR00251 family)
VAPGRLPLVQDGPDVLLELHVQPRASRSELIARPDGRLTLRLTAPPVDGAANRAACRFVAAAVALPPSRILLERGETGRHKRLRIQAADAQNIEARLLAAAKG